MKNLCEYLIAANFLINDYFSQNKRRLKKGYYNDLKID